jgi:hypothetical protein
LECKVSPIKKSRISRNKLFKLIYNQLEISLKIAPAYLSTTKSLPPPINFKVIEVIFVRDPIWTNTRENY